MSLSGIRALDSSIHRTHAWLKELCEEMGWEADHDRAYHGLRVVLHTLRDRLPAAEIADLSAQLPLLIRGCFFEGWRPAAAPLRDRAGDQFLAQVERAIPGLGPLEAEFLVRAVFRLIARHVAGGEVDDVKNALPARLRALWD